MCRNHEDDAVARLQMYLERCFDLFSCGCVAEADELAREAVGVFPDDGRLWQIRGLICQRLGHHAGACEALETASVLMPLSMAARCALADSYARTGREGLARDLYRDLAVDPSISSSLLPAIASGLGSVGDHGAALEVCRDLARRDPGCHEAQFGQAFYLRRLGRPIAEALPLIVRAHELAPEVPLYRITLASMLAHDGRRDEAYDLLTGIDPAAIGCRGCLRRMMAIFQHAGDAARLEACQDRAEDLSS